MGHEAEVKLIRRQIRNVAQQQLDDIFALEAMASLEKKLFENQAAFQKSLNEMTIKKLEKIDEEIKKILKQQDERAKQVQGFLIQTAAKEVNDLVHNTNITMLAWQELLSDKLNLGADFNSLLDARKTEISERLKKEAEAKMAQRISAAEETNKESSGSESTESKS